MTPTHNVWAYLIKDGPVRFSDDGEPGGTAGMPTLQVLQRERLFNVTCVVTRYFGGILLGAGGLVRAYARGAKIAVDAAGKSMKRVWTALYLPVPYSWYERMKLEVAAFDGLIRDTQFGADVELEVLLPEAQTPRFWTACGICLEPPWKPSSPARNTGRFPWQKRLQYLEIFPEGGYNTNGNSTVYPGRLAVDCGCTRCSPEAGASPSRVG